MCRSIRGRQHSIPAPLLCPEAQQGISVLTRKVRVNADLWRLLWAPKRRIWSRPPGPDSALGGSSAPFLLPRPPSSCSQWNNIHLFLWKLQNKEPFLLLAQRLRTKGDMFKERSFGIGRSCNQASPSGLCPWNPGGNLKIVCFFAAREELTSIWIQDVKLCFSHTDLLIVFVKSDLILTNVVFCVKITSLILAVQKTLENYLKWTWTDTILNLYPCLLNTCLQHVRKPRLYFYSHLPHQNGETHL